MIDAVDIAIETGNRASALVSINQLDQTDEYVDLTKDHILNEDMKLAAITFNIYKIKLQFKKIYEADPTKLNEATDKLESATDSYLKGDISEARLDELSTEMYMELTQYLMEERGL